MKIIISRKGFDSSAGRRASPIVQLEDGSKACCSLPIPSTRKTCTYNDLSWRGFNLGDIAHDLARRDRRDGAHLDPDLRRCSLPDRTQWRPAFGQNRGDEGHLRNQGVRPGGEQEEWEPANRPLFLFFGWFRDAALANGRWSYGRKRDGGVHAFWGWLQPSQKIELTHERRTQLLNDPNFVAVHAHAHVREQNGQYYDAKQPNAVYSAQDGDKLWLCGEKTAIQAAGALARFSNAHVLTAGGRTRGYWDLPDWFLQNNEPILGYHGRRDRWSDARRGRVILRSVGRGQEFVFDTDAVPENRRREVGDWVRGIIGAGVAGA